MAENDLKAKVLRWIRLGGIPLEYEASLVMARSGFVVAQGRSYGTADQGTVREIDVLGMLASVPNVELSLVVECKHTTNKPWIVMTNKARLSSAETMGSIIADPLAKRSLRAALQRSRGEGFGSFFGRIERPGFSAVVALGDDADRDDRNPARNAMAQVVGAARGVSAMAYGWSFVWPVVLIDGPLFALGFTDDGVEELSEVGWQRVLWFANPYGEPVAVDIVRSVDFARHAAAAFEGLSAARQVLTQDWLEYTSPENQDDYGSPKPLLGWTLGER